jgi:hypothetical protein
MEQFRTTESLAWASVINSYSLFPMVVGKAPVVIGSVMGKVTITSLLYNVTRYFFLVADSGGHVTFVK